MSTPAAKEHLASKRPEPERMVRARRQKSFFWFLAALTLFVVCLASPLFFAPLHQPDAPARGIGMPDLGQALRVDLNTADFDQLCTLPGIGEVRANAILEYRQANGPFSSLEEVCRVKGVSEKIVQGWNDLAYVSRQAG